MDIPTIHRDAVWHVGHLQGALNATSQEGAMLSVSVHPFAWEAIFKLGGAPFNRLVLQGARYVDLAALDGNAKDEAMRWASDTGLVRPVEIWRLWYSDEDAERCYFEFADRSRAEAEMGDDEDQVLEAVPGWVLTDAGMQRTLDRAAQTQGLEMGVAFWAEDVLAAEDPSIVGLWWHEDEVDVLAYKAPKGGIFTSALPRFHVERVPRSAVPEDDAEPDSEEESAGPGLR